MSCLDEFRYVCLSGDTDCAELKAGGCNLICKLGVADLFGYKDLVEDILDTLDAEVLQGTDVQES